MGRSSGAVLGISADFHDAAAAVVVDGVLVAAAAEERFSRIKHDASLPVQAIEWCLGQAAIEPGELTRVAFFEKPLSAFDRILATHAVAGPRGFRNLAAAVRAWGSSKLWIGYRIERALRRLGHRDLEIDFVEHHQSHAASAFLPSPFDRAAILVLDGVGEWASSSIAWGTGHRIEMLQESRFPDSLGLFYSAFTAFCGFDVNDGEYKLMGLAPFGTPRFVDVLKEQAIHVHDDGSIRLAQKWFDYRAGRRMTNPSIGQLLAGPARRRGEPLDQRHADIARSVQDIVEEAMMRMADHARQLTGESSLCLAGGVALNCVANEKLLEHGALEQLWVQPAAGDDGGAVGAAFWAWHQTMNRPRAPRNHCDGMSGALLGPSFDHMSVRRFLESNDVAFLEVQTHQDLCELVAAHLDDGLIVGWFQGAMEFGPRALGNRSILADPREAANVARINERVKGREGFRPFAPSVMAERCAEWFDVDSDRPYMTITAPVLPGRRIEASDGSGTAAGFAARLGEVRSQIPACTHVDMSARLQSVDAATNPRFHALLGAFFERTGCPVLINTSFNRSGEPIVRSPADALRCFRDAGLDLLVMERCVVMRGGIEP